MSDHIEHDGKVYYEESYLRLANQNTERAHAELATLRAQLSALSAGMSRIRTVLASYDADDAVGHIHEVAESFATPNLSALAAEWERGREAERLLDEGVKRRIWVQPSICGTGWQAWKQRPDGGSDWIANAGTPRDALRAAIAPAPEASA